MIFNPGYPQVTLDAPVKKTILSKTFAATGVSTSVPVDAGRAEITGTFVGTIALERQEADGTWAAIQSVTVPTVIELYKDEGRGFRNLRFNCTAYTSGSPACKIEA